LFSLREKKEKKKKEDSLFSLREKKEKKKKEDSLFSLRSTFSLLVSLRSTSLSRSARLPTDD
jgi:hypothetical protein